MNNTNRSRVSLMSTISN